MTLSVCDLSTLFNFSVYPEPLRKVKICVLTFFIYVNPPDDTADPVESTRNKQARVTVWKGNEIVEKKDEENNSTDEESRTVVCQQIG